MIKCEGSSEQNSVAAPSWWASLSLSFYPLVFFLSFLRKTDQDGCRAMDMACIDSSGQSHWKERFSVCKV